VAVLAELVEVCGAAHVRPAGPGDSPGGVAASVVVAPGDTVQLGQVVRLARERGLGVIPRGGGTKLDWGGPPSTVDVMVDSARLSGRHRHDPGELTATFGAGIRLRDVDPMLEPTGQRLALDPASMRAGATIGGVLATGETGPLRQLTGPVADLVLGLEYVDADGEIRRLTGAAATELSGSLGSLGIVTSVSLQLHPTPPATAWIQRSVSTPSELLDLVLLLDTTPLSVAAIEADWPSVDPVLARVPRPRTPPDVTGAQSARAPRPGAFAVQIEGTEAGVADRIRTGITLLGGDANATPQPPSWWGRLPAGPRDVVLRMVAAPDALHAVGYALRDATSGAVSLRGSIGAGTLLAGFPADLPAARVIGAVEAIRFTLVARGGVCNVLRAPVEVHAALQGSDPGLGKARDRKQRYDPTGLFSPGRLPLTGPL
jgi:glycolate oxidase FAD binding subunit